jgi:hypothetical protein
MEGPKVPDSSDDQRRRTLMALLSASIISLVVWAVIVAFDVR